MIQYKFFGIMYVYLTFYRISLNTMTLQVESPTVYTCQGVPISVTGIAQVIKKKCNVLLSIIIIVLYIIKLTSLYNLNWISFVLDIFYFTAIGIYLLFMKF